uniref:Uncharacterized protein n=1 Tax=Anguilla anguilla TaxID=7936 RepID=A0A0E9U6K8_ANGAN
MVDRWVTSSDEWKQVVTVSLVCGWVVLPWR